MWLGNSKNIKVAGVNVVGGPKGKRGIGVKSTQDAPSHFKEFAFYSEWHRESL